MVASLHMKLGVSVMTTVAKSSAAPWWLILIVRLVGEKRFIDHLGYRHTVGRFRGVWYHLGIKENVS